MTPRNELFIRHWYDTILAFVPCISNEVALYIACQYGLESSFGTSHIALVNQNLGGMKKPNYRPTLCYDVENKHAKFENQIMFFIDYLMWLSYSHFTQYELSNLVAFKTHLQKSGYCPSEKYISSIDEIYSQYLFIIN